MKKLTIFALTVFAVISLSSVSAYAGDPFEINIEPIPLQLPSETKGTCIPTPTAENPPFKIFSTVDIVYLAHSYTLFELDQSGIKCMAKFQLRQVLTQQTNACPVIDRVYARGELAEALCATLASALGSDFPRFELIKVKETKLGFELQDLVWQRKPPVCECPQCPQGSEGDQSGSGGGIHLEPREQSLPPGLGQ